MNRRSFFKRLAGTSAAVALGPALMSQVADHEYKTTPESSVQIGDVFTDKQGLWVFDGDRWVAWSPLHELEIHFYNNDIHIETKLEWEKATPWDGVETLHQPADLEFVVGDLHLIEENAFKEAENIKILFVYNDPREGVSRRVLTQAVWKSISFNAGLGEHITRSASFMSIGEAITEIVPL